MKMVRNLPRTIWRWIRQVSGDAATVPVPGGYQVKLKREDGIWRVEDFD